MIVVVVGPTGVGKTKLSIALAKKYDAIVLNADAMQVYKGLDIGTAKVTKEEQEGIPHYLFDIRDVSENYSVFEYQKDARKILDDNKERNIIIVGGTGLYIKALLYDYKFSEEDVNETYDGFSNEELYKMCIAKDSSMTIHMNNRRRLISFLNREIKPKQDLKLLYDCTFIGLTTDREKLYDRINLRVDKMLETGLLEEARKLYEFKESSHALKTAIGYKEIYQYFDKKMTLEEAVELLKKNSRHYAKRQYTWFKNQMDITWFNVDFDNFNNTIDETINFINEKEQ